MKHLRIYAFWALVLVALLISPIFVIIAIPLAVGIGLDIFDILGAVPFALALGALVALALLHCVAPRQRIAKFVRSRLSSGHAAEPDYAPKSMS